MTAERNSADAERKQQKPSLVESVRRAIRTYQEVRIDNISARLINGRFSHGHKSVTVQAGYGGANIETWHESLSTYAGRHFKIEIVRDDTYGHLVRFRAECTDFALDGEPELTRAYDSLGEEGNTLRAGEIIRELKFVAGVSEV